MRYAMQTWVGLCFLMSIPMAWAKPHALPQYQSKKGWIIRAQRARQLVAKGALLLDVRTARAYKTSHPQGAIHVEWPFFSETKAPAFGHLLRNLRKLQDKLRSLGITAKRPVVVFGDPLRGWGEEGRIVWMLRSVGHRRAMWVDGGIHALRHSGWPMTTQPTSPTPSLYRLQRNKRWEISRPALRRLVTNKAAFRRRPWTFLDTREAREYKGATPYGERRGGHIPNAVHLYFKDLLRPSGYLRSRRDILQRLKARGITPSTRVIAYCTGGVRSAWMVMLLADMGFLHAKNYAGSMWEWSFYPPSQYPLRKGAK